MVRRRCVMTVSFEHIRNNKLSHVPLKFIAYFECHLLSLLHADVSAGHAGWTNKNAECVNHS